MSIENNPRTDTNVNDRGDHVPSVEQADPRFGGDHEVPQPRGATTSETYVPPQEKEKDEKEIGFFRRTRTKIALGVAGLAATGAAFFAGGALQGSNDREANQVQNPPATSAEQLTSSTAASSIAEQPQTSEVQTISPEASPRSQLAIEGKVYTFEQAKESLFTISVDKAPTIDAAITEYAKTLQTGMNLNVERNVVYQLGGSEAIGEINYELLSGETGLMTNLGDGHDKVSKAPFNNTEPSTLAWERSVKNAEEETTSEVYILNPEITTNAENNYKVRGDLLVTDKTQSTDEPTKTDEYRIQIHARIDPATNRWVFGTEPYVTHILRNPQ